VEVPDQIVGADVAFGGETPAQRQNHQGGVNTAIDSAAIANRLMRVVISMRPIAGRRGRDVAARVVERGGAARIGQTGAEAVAAAVVVAGLLRKRWHSDPHQRGGDQQLLCNRFSLVACSSV